MNLTLDTHDRNDRWGPKIEEHTYKAKYRVYFSEQVSSETRMVRCCSTDGVLCMHHI